LNILVFFGDIRFSEAYWPHRHTGITADMDGSIALHVNTVHIVYKAIDVI
ncbi:hypothetical protein ACJX0J_030823, partial [Zea mays]